MNTSLMREHRPVSKHEANDYEQKVRSEMIRGCTLAKQLEKQLNQAPVGSFCQASNDELRLRFFRASFEIAASFHSVTVLLESKSIGSQQFQLSAHVSKERIPPQKRIAHGRGSATPPLSPQDAANVLGRQTPSPPLSSSDMSDGSPKRRRKLDPDLTESATAADWAGGNRNQAAGLPDNQADLSVRDNLRKRKAMPKFTFRIPCVNSDQGSEIPPDDGHTWRKYGQKEILGARYPRSYYRCTHKNDTGCPAIKQVQRTDDNPRVFEVTYRGNHTCCPPSFDTSFWPLNLPLSTPPLTIQPLQTSQFPANFNLSPTFNFNGNGGVELNTLSPQLPPPLFQFPFLSSLASQPAHNSSLSLQPSVASSFSMPSISLFGSTTPNDIKFEPVSGLETGNNMLGASNRLNGLVPQRDLQSNATTCCNFPETIIDTDQKPSILQSFVIPEHDDNIYSEVEKVLGVPPGKELETYNIIEQVNADSKSSAHFSPQVVLNSATNNQEARRLFHEVLKEQPLESDPDATKVGIIFDMELLNSPFSDDLFCMQL